MSGWRVLWAVAEVLRAGTDEPVWQPWGYWGDSDWLEGRNDDGWFGLIEQGPRG